MKALYHRLLPLFLILLVAFPALSEGLWVDEEAGESLIAPPLELSVPEEETTFIGEEANCQSDSDEIENGHKEVSDPDLQYNANGMQCRLSSDGVLVVLGSSTRAGCTEDIDRSLIKKVIIEEGPTVIGQFGFQRCKNLVSVSIPRSVTKIEAYAFCQCESLREITIPDSITDFGESCFANCDSLTEVYIPDSVINLNEVTFSSCDNLSKVRLPRHITILGSAVFYECPALTSIDIPEGVTKILGDAFRGCTNLTQVKLPSTLKSIGIRTFCDSGIVTIDIPESVTEIRQGAFSRCQKLVSLTIPEGETKLDWASFQYDVSLRSVTIPASVTEISQRAFYGCDINQITIYGYSGTKAESYAADMSMAFVSLGNRPTQGPSPSINPSPVPSPSPSPTSKPVNPETTEFIYTKNASTKGVVGDRIQLTPGKGVKVNKYKSSNKKIASVSKTGLVKLKKKGKVKIKVTLSNQKQITLTIKVYKPKSPKNVKLAEGKKLKIKKGKSVQLHPVLTPDTARTTYTWKTSKKKVVSVSKTGVIKGLKKGTAKITVTTANNKTYTITVKVT